MNIKHDEIEESIEYKKVVNEVDMKARNKVNAVIQKLMDECDNVEMKSFISNAPTFHRFEYEKKKILKEEYGIEWKSVIELNPNINFD